MKVRRKWVAAVGLVIMTAAVAACASQPESAAPGVPGFWLGLVHGCSAPIALIVHLFNHDVRIYAFPNSGGWYDFGFILGVGSLGGGAASAR